MTDNDSNLKSKIDIFKWLTIFNTVAVFSIIAFLGYMFFISRKAPSADAQQAQAKQIDMGQLTQGAPFSGPENAKVSIVMFNSFTCGFCKKVSPVLNQVLQKYPDKVRLVYRHFIRNEVDLAAANATECAGEQNKFWQMHDQIFAENGGEFNYKLYARNIGINLAQFDACVASNKYSQKARSDSEMGQYLGVQGTPTFVINGELVVGYRPFEAFDAVVKQSL